MTFISVSTIACVYLVHNVDKLQWVNLLAVWMQFTVQIVYFLDWNTKRKYQRTVSPTQLFNINVTTKTLFLWINDQFNSVCKISMKHLFSCNMIWNTTLTLHLNLLVFFVQKAVLLKTNCNDKHELSWKMKVIATGWFRQLGKSRRKKWT